VDDALDDDLIPAIPAATVVLLRDGPDGLETLMLRRDARVDFGGAWVFPGGRIDPADYPDGVVSDEPDALAAAARTAAVREALEESALVVDPDSLVWFSHWTPDRASGAPRRYATWFFVAAAPTGQVVVDDSEIRDHLWIRPTDALERFERGEIALIPPTFVTLHTLAEWDSITHAYEVSRGRDPLIFLSRVVRNERGAASLWGGDSAYDDGDLDRPGPRRRLLMYETGWQLEID
jgi:8-oxo-dGTP pyrophosphatase MutT (NUDIX family)